MPLPIVHIWKKAPFLRLLIPLIIGIILQWNLQVELKISVSIFILALITLVCFFFLPFFKKFRLTALNGLSINCLLISVGAILTWNKNIRHEEAWFGNSYLSTNSLIVSLTETPIEKTKSFKATASIDFITKKDSALKSTGTIIIYFKKDSIVSNLKYGTRLLINKPLQEIKNSGNPGGFNYKRYSLFQGITHQVYLKENEFEILKRENKNQFAQFLISSREKVLNILRKNIKGEKELGLAEALLIGYKDDLDKNLIQSYSNTGVIHVIAISGLHLGLIYWLLLFLLKPLGKKKQTRWLKPILIITGLWLFSLLAGAQPSIVRSAVMFTCIVLGESLTRKTSIYNTLAFSAFILLCYNPFWLWDVGFQLSYSAVLSIVIFMRPIYNWFYIKNKALDLLWKLNAVTIAAQILTVPISIYHFHQFPASFLLTNFLAVPLSSLILLGEIFLCVFSVIPVLADVTGSVLSWLIWLMNSYIERIEMIPYSLIDRLQISIPQSVLLMISAAGIGFWLLEKSKLALRISLLTLLSFSFLRSYSLIKINNQEKIIVYNVPQKKAIDFVNSQKFLFVGDADLLADDFIRNFHLKPSRILNRINQVSSIEDYFQSGNLITYKNKKILLIDSTINFVPANEKFHIDLVVISNNPRLYFKNLSETFTMGRVVTDGSTPSWKINYWKKDCDSLGIAFHDVNEKGAFVMSIR